MEGLRNLSPRRLQALLSDCKSVKVKRLFFWFAERHNHAWLQKIDQLRYRPRQRQAHARARRQARLEIQHHGAGEPRCRRLSNFAGRRRCWSARSRSSRAETCFALKGGTAINLFVRDMPRLSVDIDLTYLPVEDRATSLANIDAAMQRLEQRIREGLRGARATSVRLKPENIVSKIFVEADGVQIKIEVTPGSARLCL